MKAEFSREADFRRNVLAFLVARDAYPDWQQGELISAIPPSMIDEYHAYPGRALVEVTLSRRRHRPP